MKQTLWSLALASVLATPAVHARVDVKFFSADLDAEALAWTPTADYNSSYSWNHKLINDKVAYDLGYFGKSVLVGIVDTGIQLTNPEFTGRITASKTFVTGTTTANDDSGHGTHVSGIIAAAADGKGSMGVAPKASLVVAKVLDKNGAGYSSTVFNGLDYVVSQGAKVVNLSAGWSTSSSTDITRLKSVVSKGALLVMAAGNAGGANPLWPARYSKDAWANGQFLAVGAVDSNKVITSWSNRAGDAMNYYLVAPGNSVYSTYNNGSYAYMSGTSMAAPHVTGAAALLMSYWPALSAKDTGSILLTTATDLGAKGVDAVYGHGLLNVQAALAPVGTLKLASNSAKTKTTSLGSATVASGAVYGAVKSLGTGLITAGLDDYGRNYAYDASASVAVDSAASGVRGKLDGMLASLDAPAQGSGWGYAGRQTGFAAAKSGFLGLAANGLSYQTEGAGTFQLGLVTGATASPSETTQQAVTLSSPVFGMGVSVGYAREHGTFLGSHTSGALVLGSGESTFLALSKNMRAGVWDGTFTASYGTTTATAPGGMVLAVSPVQSVSVTAELKRRHLLRQDDEVTLSLAQPMRIVAGSMTVESVAYDAEGAAHFSTKALGLAGGAVETDLALSYGRPVSKRGRVAMEVGYRMNADQVAGTTDVYLTTGYLTRF